MDNEKCDQTRLYDGVRRWYLSEAGLNHVRLLVVQFTLGKND